MSEGIITYVNEEGEDYRVKNPMSNIEYKTYPITKDKVEENDRVEVADINNERMLDNSQKDKLRFLPVRGGYPYSPSCRWFKWDELIANGKWASLIKSYAFFTAWQKKCPVYRIGIISRIIDNKYSDVTIDRHWGMGSFTKRCRVDYMTCDTGAFQVGDEVVVKFLNWDYRKPVVVGFLNNPKPCDEFLSIVISAPTIGSAVYGFIWNPAKNTFAFVPSLANPEIQIDMPCEYSEIASFINSYPTGDVDNFNWTWSTIRHKVQDSKIGIGHDSFENFSSGDCNPLPDSNQFGMITLDHYDSFENSWEGSGVCSHNWSEQSSFDPLYTDIETLSVNRSENTPLPVDWDYDIDTNVDGYSKTYGIRSWSTALFFSSSVLNWLNFTAKINTTEEYTHEERMRDWKDDSDDIHSIHHANSTRKYETYTNFGAFFDKSFIYELNDHSDGVFFKQATVSRYYPNCFGFKSDAFSAYAYIAQGWTQRVVNNGGADINTTEDVDVFVHAALFLNEVDSAGKPVDPFTFSRNIPFELTLKECIERVLLDRTLTPTTGPGSLDIDIKILSGKVSGSFSSNSSSSKSISSSSLSRSSSSRSSVSSLSHWKPSSSSSSKSSRSSTSISKSSQSILKLPSSSSESSSSSSLLK